MWVFFTVSIPAWVFFFIIVIINLRKEGSLFLLWCVVVLIFTSILLNDTVWEVFEFVVIVFFWTLRLNI